MTAAGTPLGRLPTLAILALVVLLPAVLVAAGFLAAGAAERENAAAARQLDGLQARVAAIRTALGDKRAAPEAVAATYLPAGTPALAGADMQQRLADMIANAGGRLLESQVVPADAAENDPGRVDLQVSFEARVAGLQQVLFGVETGTPILFVRSLGLRSLAADGEGDGTDRNADPTLRVDLTVAGYQAGPAP
jgi:general secretion pathway protein M